MTEPPRPPDGYPDPNRPPQQTPGSYGEAPGYAPPPTSGAGYTPPPTSGGGYPPPTSGAGYNPPPTSGAGYGQQPGGYQQPGYQQQPGQYGQPGAYGAPGAPGMGGVAPAGYANQDEKTWALISHFGGAAGMLIFFGVGGFIGPLIALLAKGNTSPTVRAHAIEALNFQILWGIIGVIGWALACVVIGFVIAPIAAIIAIVFGIIGGIRANEGQLYHYPMSVRMIK